jgi:hypothetical protein
MLKQNSAYPRAARWFFAWPIFGPEDGCDIFLRNVGSHTMLHL